MTGVSRAARSCIERAVELGAQLVLVHHGLFWDFHPTGLTPAARRAAAAAVQARHHARRLPPAARRAIRRSATTRCSPSGSGCERHEPFGEHKGRRSAPGTFAGDGIAAAELFARVARGHGARAARCSARGPERVRRIGIVSGSAARLRSTRPSRSGLDAFLTGEPREHVMADAREARHPLHRRRPLRDRDVRRSARSAIWLADRFGVEHVFFDIPNPV